jgi:hypothetical protein
LDVSFIYKLTHFQFPLFTNKIPTTNSQQHGGTTVPVTSIKQFIQPNNKMVTLYKEQDKQGRHCSRHEGVYGQQRYSSTHSQLPS